MSTSVVDSAAVDVHVSDSALTVVLRDRREITVPLEWFPPLRNATPAERTQWRIIGDGEGIHWPALDEDLSVEGLLRAH